MLRKNSRSVKGKLYLSRIISFRPEMAVFGLESIRIIRPKPVSVVFGPERNIEETTILGSENHSVSDECSS